MTTSEYLWWVETIRQDTFRRKLPSNIVGWVALTICLVAFILYILAGSLKDAQVQARTVSYFIFIISYIVGFISLGVSYILSKKSDIKIKEVKKLWESQSNENKDVNEKLKWFYSL